MNAPSPLAGKTDLVTTTITIDGKVLPATCTLTQIRVHKEVNRIPLARITLLDGDPSSETFELSASARFLPGKPVRVAAGYHGKESLLFEGVIVKHGVKVRGDRQSFLVLTCYDKAVRLTQGRKSASLGKTDSEVLEGILTDAGLKAKVEATSAAHDGLVRYYATDWDFLVSRAELNGKIVLVEAGSVSIAAPVCSGESVLRIGYGDALQEIDAEIDARGQYGAVSCTAWDIAQQKVITAEASEPNINLQGNVSNADLAAVLGRQTMHLQSATPLPDAELKIWADAQLLKSRMARVRGQVTFRGNARPAPGCLVELDGLGERFNGQAFVSRVVHYIDDGNWRTELGFGMAPGWFVEETPAVAAPLASGMLPGISGLQIGVVRKIDADPDGQTRVQVDVPMVGATGEGIWARLASAYATAEAGIFFVPEPGDEVVLGFLNGNPSFPVVLGSLYSSKHTPPYAADAPNTNKAIVTKGKLKISFEDVEHRIRIETPDKRVITLDDKAKTLTLSDGANTVELAQGGITMTSKGDIRIEAGGSLTLKAEVAVAVGAPRVDLKADAAMTLKGEGSVELGSSGKATVQAPLVMIN